MCSVYLYGWWIHKNKEAWTNLRLCNFGSHHQVALYSDMPGLPRFIIYTMVKNQFCLPKFFASVLLCLLIRPAFSWDPTRLACHIMPDCFNHDAVVNVCILGQMSTQQPKHLYLDSLGGNLKRYSFRVMWLQENVLTLENYRTGEGTMGQSLFHTPYYGVRRNCEIEYVYGL